MKSERMDIVKNDEIPSSITALSVATALVRSLETGYRHLFTEQELSLTKHLTSVGKNSLGGFNYVVNESLSALPYSIQHSIFNMAVIPDYDHLVMLRKWLIKNKVNAAIDNGVKQIVILGGGYDIRALITALQYPEVTLYEIDRGPTRACKINGLKSIPDDLGLGDIMLDELDNGTVIVNKNLFYIDCDLGKKSLQDVLFEYGFSINNKTLFIAEGLTMYLDEKENRSFLTSCSQIMKDTDEILLNYLSKIAYTRLAEYVHNSNKEQFRFSLLPKDVITFAGEWKNSILSQR